MTPADKGGAVVVQNFSSWKDKGLRQLNDQSAYARLPNDPTQDIARKSNKYLQQLRTENVIDENTYKWGLTEPGSCKTPYFYHLPKIHQRLDNPPGRPIVSGIGGPTEKLSKLTDYWLQPAVKVIPSYIQDTTHFLQTIESWNSRGPLPRECLFVTIDVVGLYIPIFQITK